MNKQQFKDFVQDKKVEVAAIGSSIVASGAMVPALAFAEGETPTVAGTLTTGVTSAVSGAQEAIIAVLPQALILMGVVLGITIGVRLFKRIGK